MLQSFSFPLLKDEDLLPHLHDLEVPLDVQQLQKPTYEVVKPLFEGLITALTMVSREELNQPVFEATDAFEYPELQDESVACLSFYRHLSKLLANTGVKDFGLRDIYKPESERLRRQLSALINYAKFKDEKVAACQEWQARLDALMEEKRILEQQNREQMERVRALELDGEAEQEEASKVEAEAAVVYQQNMQLSKQQHALASDAKALKDQANQLAEQTTTEKFELANMQQENERLQSELVQSPDKFQAALAEAQQELENERQMKCELVSHAQQLKTRLETVQKCANEVAQVVPLMEEVQQEVQRKKDASHALKQLRQTGSAIDIGDIDMGTKVQYLKRQHAAFREKMQRMEHQYALKDDAAESYVQQQVKEREVAEAENAAKSAKEKEQNAQIRAMLEHIKELQANHEAQVKALTDEFNNVARLTEEHSAWLLQTLAETSSMDVLDPDVMVE